MKNNYHYLSDDEANQLSPEEYYAYQAWLERQTTTPEFRAQTRLNNIKEWFSKRRLLESIKAEIRAKIRAEHKERLKDKGYRRMRQIEKFRERVDQQKWA